MTCGEFLRFDDAAKPEIVHWLAIRNEPGTKGIVVDVDVTDRMVPTVVDSCRDVPTALLSKKVRAEADRLGAKLYSATTPTSTQ